MTKMLRLCDFQRRTNPQVKSNESSKKLDLHELFFISLKTYFRISSTNCFR